MPARPATPTRGRTSTSGAGEGVVAPRSSPRPHLQGSRHLEVTSDETHLEHSPAHRRARLDRHPAWLGPPPPRARARHLPGPARPLRPGPGGAAGRHCPCLPRRPTVEVTGIATANPQAPGGVEVTEAVVTALTDDAETPPFELWRPELTVSLPTLLDHAPVAWRHPAQQARWELAAASLRGLPLDPRRARLHRDPDAEVRGVRDRVGGQRVRGRLLRAAGVPRPEPAVLQAAAGRASSSGSTRSGPVFRAEPHDTVRHLAEYVSLDVELGFIRDHRDVLAVLREVLAGMVAGASARRLGRAARGGAARGARRDPGRALQRGAGDRRARPPTSPTSPPSTSGRSASGRARRTAATSSPSRAIPWRSGRSTPTRSRADPRWTQQLRPALPRTRAGHRRPAAAPLRRLPGRPRGRAVRTRRPTTAYLAGVPARHAPARRLRHRARAVGRPARRRPPTSAR